MIGGSKKSSYLHDIVYRLPLVVLRGLLPQQPAMEALEAGQRVVKAHLRDTCGTGDRKFKKDGSRAKCRMKQALDRGIVARYLRKTHPMRASWWNRVVVDMKRSLRGKSFQVGASLVALATVKAELIKQSRKSCHS